MAQFPVELIDTERIFVNKYVASTTTHVSVFNNKRKIELKGFFKRERD